MKTSTVLVACFAALLLVSSCQAAWGRELKQVVATSNSVAGPGETVISGSKASSEKGEPTVSVVNASGSGPGTTVNCQEEAKSGQIKSKECGGAKIETPTWDKAPVCKKAPKEYKVAKDAQGHPWGFDDVSCALRGPDGKALA